MLITWTESQKGRLKELNASLEVQEMVFGDNVTRDRSFQRHEKDLVAAESQRLLKFRTEIKRPGLSRLEAKLIDALTGHEFVQVTTPIILAKGLLAKMTIDEDHHLAAQVFWLDNKRCLRPMLAPNLYYLLRSFARLWEKPIRIFEIGPCFRKDSQGANHLNEFTMLNLVELGVPEEQREARLKELATIIMETVGITDYQLVSTESEVYGQTIDVEVNEIEVGSGAMGPHPLDKNWGIVDSWVGIGFGVERLLMLKEGSGTISRVGRSLTYLDNICLNI
ncbi:MAG: pyrrolysine--tRNA(Pyl) ligase large subunit [Bacillota bacterium]|nr:pyrrolysine--tRNA(Pyl) ligase large subunit [Bacillota bacterium]